MPGPRKFMITALAAAAGTIRLHHASHGIIAARSDTSLDRPCQPIPERSRGGGPFKPAAAPAVGLLPPT